MQRIKEAIFCAAVFGTITCVLFLGFLMHVLGKNISEGGSVENLSLWIFCRAIDMFGRAYDFAYPESVTT